MPKADISLSRIFSIIRTKTGGGKSKLPCSEIGNDVRKWTGIAANVSGQYRDIDERKACRQIEYQLEWASSQDRFTTESTEDAEDFLLCALCVLRGETLLRSG